MTHEAINIGEGYRRLGYVETLRLGDQVWDGAMWQPVSPTYLLQCKTANGGLYRRPVPQTISLKPAGSKNSARGR